MLTRDMDYGDCPVGSRQAAATRAVSRAAWEAARASVAQSDDPAAAWEAARMAARKERERQNELAAAEVEAAARVADCAD